MHHPADQSLELQRNRWPTSLALPAPVKPEVLVVPTDKVRGATTVRAPRQSNQRLSQRRVTRLGCEIRRGLILRSW